VGRHRGIGGVFAGGARLPRLPPPHPQQLHQALLLLKRSGGGWGEGLGVHLAQDVCPLSGRGEGDAAAYEAAFGFVGPGRQLAAAHTEAISVEFDHPADAALAVPLKPLAEVCQPLRAILGHSPAGEIWVKLSGMLTGLQRF